MTHANSISFDLAWYSILSQYSASVRRTVCDAVLNFALTGEIPLLKGIAKVAFQFISHEISKQLGKLPVEGVIDPVPAVADTGIPEGEMKDVVEIQLPECMAEPIAEPVAQFSEDDAMTEIPDSFPSEAVPATVQEVIAPPYDIVPEEISSECHETSEKQHLAVPEPRLRKQRGCISRNRMPVGKISCIRKGSKMVFRRR